MKAIGRNCAHFFLGAALAIVVSGCSNSPVEPLNQPETTNQPSKEKVASPATTGSKGLGTSPRTGKELYDLLVRSGATNGRLVLASQTGQPTTAELAASDLSGHPISTYWACTSNGKGLEITVNRDDKQVLWGGSEGCSNRWSGLTSPSLPASTRPGTLKIDPRQATSYVFCLVADDEAKG